MQRPAWKWPKPSCRLHVKNKYNLILFWKSDLLLLPPETSPYDVLVPSSWPTSDWQSFCLGAHGCPTWKNSKEVRVRKAHGRGRRRGVFAAYRLGIFSLTHYLSLHRNLKVLPPMRWRKAQKSWPRSRLRLWARFLTFPSPRLLQRSERSQAKKRRRKKRLRVLVPWLFSATKSKWRATKRYNYPFSYSFLGQACC